MGDINLIIWLLMIDSPYLLLAVILYEVLDDMTYKSWKDRLLYYGTIALILIAFDILIKLFIWFNRV